jgi:putative tricarboxylic transport membrane protein
MGTLGQPGAGFLPFWVGAALGLMSVGLIARSLHRRPGAPGDGSEGRERRRMLGVLGGLVFYSLLLEPVGFLPGTFLLLAGLTRLLGAPGWRAALGFGALGALGSYALFGVFLGVPLPKGAFLP